MFFKYKESEYKHISLNGKISLKKRILNRENLNFECPQTTA